MLNNNNICSSELTETEAKSLDIVSNMLSLCIKCAMKLNIPNILHKNANPIMSLTDLIAALPNLNPSKISFIPILMRVLVDFGIFNYHHQPQGDGYSLTDVSRALVENDRYNNRSLFLFSQYLLKTIASLNDWLCNDLPTAFETAHGKSFWDYCAEKPEFSGVFNDVMDGDSRLISSLLVSDCCKYVFEGLTSLVDVGGGTGTVAMAIAEAFPNLKCTVLDLPHAIGDRKEIENVEFVVGNMFDKIPQANAILLKVCSI